MINRLVIQDAIEKWRDDCLEAGIDSVYVTALFDDNLVKDLARDILTVVRAG
jgi:hypothetical protein